MKFHVPLLARIVVAIVLGILLGTVLPLPVARIFATFNGLFSNLLQFIIPVMIVGLVVPAIAGIGVSAGRLLLITVAIAYGDTVVAGLLSYGTSASVFPLLMDTSAAPMDFAGMPDPTPYFTVDFPPLFGVMSGLVLSFILGLGIASFRLQHLKGAFDELKDIISALLERVVIPLLPVYIFGIFCSMAQTNKVGSVLTAFLSIILVIFAMHVVLLLLQYCVAGLIVKRNPLRMLWTMMPAYFTALGTSSSAATIPVALRQARQNRVSDGVAGFVMPLCATIHLSGSCLKIVSCAVALMMMEHIPFDFPLMLGFILMLGVLMVAAPGVPGGSIMAALGALTTILGFTDEQNAMMIALYIAMDSFGTACNVTGDGAIAVVVDKINQRHQPTS